VRHIFTLTVCFNTLLKSLIHWWARWSSWWRMHKYWCGWVQRILWFLASFKNAWVCLSSSKYTFLFS